MARFGGFLMLLGLASIALTFTSYQLRLLAWVDNWGTQNGWFIRGGVVALGLVCMLLGRQKKESK